MEYHIECFRTRQQMQTKNYEVFHYKDDKLGSVTAHHHDFYEVYIFLGGEVEYWVEGQNYALKSGDVLLISPLELHKAQVCSQNLPYERIVLWVHPTYLQTLSDGKTNLAQCFDRKNQSHTNLLRLNLTQITQVKSLAERLIAENHSDAFGSEAAAKAVLSMLMIELNRMAMECMSISMPQEDTEEHFVEYVLTYIDEHYQQDILLDRLAEDFFVSKYHLAHEFKRMVGTSVYHYIMLKRLVMSKQMLREGMPPTQVYRHCGFKNYATFYRAFRNEYNISPKQFLSET